MKTIRKNTFETNSSSCHCVTIMKPSAYDAVNFAFTMTELSKDQNDVLHGLTGDISLGKDGLIESSAMWVELGKLR